MTGPERPGMKRFGSKVFFDEEGVSPWLLLALAAQMFNDVLSVTSYTTETA